MRAYQQVPKQVYQGLLGNASATLYTVPATQTGANLQTPPKAMLTEIVVSNIDGSWHAVTIYVVPNGGSAGNSTTLIPGKGYDGNEFMRHTFATVMEQGATIRGFADTANKVNVTISAVEMLPRQRQP